MRVLIVQNDPQVPPGHLEQVAAQGHELRVRLASEGNLDAGSFDVVVLLGGEMGAFDTAEHPWLDDEKAFIRKLVADDVPVLGVCLGCQLLADALGGRAYPAPAPEARFEPVTMRSADATVAALSFAPVLMLHDDTWDPPPEATVVAESASYLQAFRLGSALGIQPHPELTPAIVADWFGSDDVRRSIEKAGNDPDGLRAALDANAKQIAATADHFFGAWLEEAAADGGAA